MRASLYLRRFLWLVLHALCKDHVIATILTFRLCHHQAAKVRCKLRRYGYQGFYNKTEKPVVLTRKNVDGIQLTGGTILGTSRGGADIKCAPHPPFPAVQPRRTV